MGLIDVIRNWPCLKDPPRQGDEIEAESRARSAVSGSPASGYRAEAPVLEESNGSGGQVIGTEQINTLPLDGHKPMRIGFLHSVMRKDEKLLLEAFAQIPGVEVVPIDDRDLTFRLPFGPCEVDLVLIDISLPGRNGIWLVNALREIKPRLPCLVLSGYASKHYVEQAMDAGARGYVLKEDVPGILEGIRLALTGGVYISEALRGT